MTLANACNIQTHTDRETDTLKSIGEILQIFWKKSIIFSP